MTPTVRFDPKREDWYFGDEWRRTDGAYSLVIKHMDLPIAKATDLARALRMASRLDAAPDEVIVDTAPDDEYSPKESVGGPIAFRLDEDNTLLVELTFSSDTYIDQREELQSTLGPLIEPYLRRQHADVHSIEPDAYRSMAPYFHKVALAVPTRNRSLLDLYTIADNCPVPGLMEALIPRKDESHGSTEEVSRGASGTGDPDGGRSAA